MKYYGLECQVPLDFFQSGLTLHGPHPLFFGSVPLQVANASGSPVPQRCLSLLVPLRFMDSADPALTLLHCVSSFLLNRPYALLLLPLRPCEGGALTTAPDVGLFVLLCVVCQAAIGLFFGALSHMTPETPASFWFFVFLLIKHFKTTSNR